MTDFFYWHIFKKTLCGLCGVFCFDLGVNSAAGQEKVFLSFCIIFSIWAKIYLQGFKPWKGRKTMFGRKKTKSCTKGNVEAAKETTSTKTPKNCSGCGKRTTTKGCK